jgi:hypothetical protein
MAGERAATGVVRRRYGHRSSLSIIELFQVQRQKTHNNVTLDNASRRQDEQGRLLSLQASRMRSLMQQYTLAEVRSVQIAEPACQTPLDGPA